MALTESTMLPLGTEAPAFSLPDTVSGNTVSLADYHGDVATVVMFICNHCPYVLHIQNKLVEVAKQYDEPAVRFIAISSNDAETYPNDGPDKMASIAKSAGYAFPYLYDETQSVAKAYHAACTPDFYIFDHDLHCVYRGRFDDSSPGKADVPVTGSDLRRALDAVIAQQPVDSKQLPSMGCNIKWK